MEYLKRTHERITDEEHGRYAHRIDEALLVAVDSKDSKDELFRKRNQLRKVIQDLHIECQNDFDMVGDSLSRDLQIDPVNLMLLDGDFYHAQAMIELCMGEDDANFAVVSAQKAYELNRNPRECDVYAHAFVLWVNGIEKGTYYMSYGFSTFEEAVISARKMLADMREGDHDTVAVNEFAVAISRLEAMGMFPVNVEVGIVPSEIDKLTDAA